MLRTACALQLALLATAASGARLPDSLGPLAWLGSWVDDASDALGRWHRPKECGSHECPCFKVLETGDEYEMREYKEAVYAATNVSGLPYATAYLKAMTRLHAYFHRHNKGHHKLDPTVPILSGVKLKEGGGLEQDFIFALYLPRHYHKHPPKPRDKDVELVCEGRRGYYAANFSGFATEVSIVQQANRLRTVLKADDRDFGEELVWIGAYDPPTKIMGRFNEIYFEMPWEE